jgi:hypothetical protein
MQELEIDTLLNQTKGSVPVSLATTTIMDVQHSTN